MISTKSHKEQMQLELQWWEEQMICASNDGDLIYLRECKDNVSKLLSDILNLE